MAIRHTEYSAAHQLQEQAIESNPLYNVYNCIQTCSNTGPIPCLRRSEVQI